jgi:hypothetical protein
MPKILVRDIVELLAALGMSPKAPENDQCGVPFNKKNTTEEERRARLKPPALPADLVESAREVTRVQLYRVMLEKSAQLPTKLLGEMRKAMERCKVCSDPAVEKYCDDCAWMHFVVSEVGIETGMLDLLMRAAVEPGTQVSKEIEEERAAHALVCPDCRAEQEREQADAKAIKDTGGSTILFPDESKGWS